MFGPVANGLADNEVTGRLCRSLDGALLRAAHGVVLYPVFQVPAVLEEGEQIIEPRGRVPFRALYFPERTLQPFELRLPRGHA